MKLRMLIYIVKFIMVYSSVLYAQDATLIANEGKKTNEGKNKEIIYLKDGTFLECDKVHKGAYIWEPTFPLITLYIGCGDKTVEYDKIEKIIYSDGSTKFEGELMRTSNKIKFWYYSGITGIILVLVLLAS